MPKSLLKPFTDKTSAHFHITRGRGFRLTFDNGYALSVQFGANNYCENRGKPSTSLGRHDVPESQLETGCTSSNAEVAVFCPDGKFYPISEHDDVEGWLSVDEVAELLDRVRKLTDVPEKDADGKFVERDPFGLMRDLRNDDQD